MSSSGHFVITLTSLAVAAGVGAITGVTFSAIEQYGTRGTIDAGTTVKAAFIGATGGVVGVATAGIVGATLAGAGLGTTFSSTLAVGGVQGLTTGIAVRSNTELLNSAFAQFEGKSNKISIEDSMSRVFNPTNMTTDAIAGGVAEGLLYMANSAATKNQAQPCAEGEISKNANLLKGNDDIIQISDKKMYQLGYHFNQHGRAMGYSSKNEYDAGARDFIAKHKDSAEIYDGKWNASRGIEGGKKQIIIRAEGMQVIIDEQSGQIIDFYEGTSLNGFINIRRIK